MQTEHGGVSEERDLINLCFNQLLGVSFVGDHVVVVSSREEELLVGVKDKVAHKLLKVGV